MKNIRNSKTLFALTGLVLALSLASCGTDTASTSTSSAAESTSSETADTSTDTTTTYTATFPNIETWDYSFVNINSFGQEAGVGMINLNSWGNKKLKLGDDGTCDGVGCNWTLTFTPSDTTYTFALTAHLIGAGDVYSGEGDFAYTFTGTETVGTDSYVLSAPTYVKVTLTGDITCIGDKTDFANYLPDAPYSVDSNGEGDVDACKKIVPEKLIPTIFGGATFNVADGAVTSVTDITFPTI